MEINNKVKPKSFMSLDVERIGGEFDHNPVPVYSTNFQNSKNRVVKRENLTPSSRLIFSQSESPPFLLHHRIGNTLYKKREREKVGGR